MYYELLQDLYLDTVFTGFYFEGDSFKMIFFSWVKLHGEMTWLESSDHYHGLLFLVEQHHKVGNYKH